MRATHPVPVRYQRGISLTGLIVGLAIFGFLAILASRIIPSYIEYRAIISGIQKAKRDGGADVREIRNSFNKAREINDITAITANDLVISRDTGMTEISFAYEKRIPLFANATLLLDFSGSTAPGGPAPKAE